MKRNYKDLPIYKKAEEIEKLVESITSFVEDYEFKIEYEIEQEMVDDSIASMKDKAYQMQFAIQDTCSQECQYHEAMEKAVMVKYYVNEIVCDVNRLESAGLKESDFVDVFHDTLEEFRLLFVEWVKTFPKWKYYDWNSHWNLFESDDVVVINYTTGERNDEDNPLHSRMSSQDDEYWEEYEDDHFYDDDYEDDEHLQDEDED